MIFIIRTSLMAIKTISRSIKKAQSTVPMLAPDKIKNVQMVGVTKLDLREAVKIEKNSEEFFNLGHRSWTIIPYFFF